MTKRKFLRFENEHLVSTEEFPIFVTDDLLYDEVVYKRDLLRQKLNLNNIAIPYIPEKHVKLTSAGKLTGALFSTNMLDSIAKYGARAGLPFTQAIGLAALESSLGNAKTNGYTSQKDKGVIYGSGLISNWSHGRNNPYGDLLVTSEIKSGVRDVKRDGRRRDLLLTIGLKLRIWPYVKAGLNYAEKLMKAFNSDLNVLEHGFRLFRSGKYNVGDPNHTKDVKEAGRQVMQSPEIKQWWNTIGKNIMTYSEATLRAATGDILMLPNFIGYFKWDYRLLLLMFYNGDYKCRATDLDIVNRNDWYYII